MSEHDRAAEINSLQPHGYMTPCSSPSSHHVILLGRSHKTVGTDIPAPWLPHDSTFIVYVYVPFFERAKHVHTHLHCRERAHLPAWQSLAEEAHVHLRLPMRMCSYCILVHTYMPHCVLLRIRLFNRAFTFSPDLKPILLLPLRQRLATATALPLPPPPRSSRRSSSSSSSSTRTTSTTVAKRQSTIRILLRLYPLARNEAFSQALQKLFCCRYYSCRKRLVTCQLRPRDLPWEPVASAAHASTSQSSTC